MQSQNMHMFRFLFVVPVLASGIVTDDLSVLANYVFVPDPITLLNFTSSGDGRVLSGRGIQDCKKPVEPGASDIVDGVALVLVNIGQGCFSSGDYSNGDFLVQPGTATGGEFTFRSYRVSPPSITATNFVASGQELYVNVTSKLKHTIFSLKDGIPIQMGVAQAPANIDTGSGVFIPTGVRIDHLKAVSVFLVVPASQSVPKVTRNVVSAGSATMCMDHVPEAAVVGNLAVVTTKSNSCYTDGKYNNDEVLVESGKLEGSDGNSYGAYRVSPPRVQASEFSSSKLSLQLRSATAKNVSLRSFDESKQHEGFSTLSTLSLPANDAFVPLNMNADDLVGPTVLIALAPSARLSRWPLVTPDVEGAWLAGGDVHGGYSISARRFTVSTEAEVSLKPFDPTSDWTKGPGSHSGNYGIQKMFFPVNRTDGREGVVWQDQSTHNVFMTFFAEDLKSASTTRLLKTRDWLVAAACDAQDQIALLLVGEKTPSQKSSSNTVKIRRVSSTSGNLLKEAVLDSSKKGLDVYKFFASGGSMVWNVGQGMIMFILSRTMTVAGDGLNHQGAIAVVLDAESLSVLKNFGQTSGHSFSNSLVLGNSVDWIGMDLGDNYPRGIHMHSFSPSKRKSRLVYTFKTKHGTTPRSPAGATYPEYSEISSSEQKFYQWSNDNYVYTELAHPGVVEVDDGLLIFFAGEQPPLDNSKAGAPMNVPRNVGFVKIPKDLSSEEVLSSGAVETGGFYTFGGAWSAQKNEGIQFLTSYSASDECVTRIKTARLGGNNTVLLWERWSGTSFKDAQWMIVDDSGQQVAAPVTPGYAMRLAIQDDVRIIGNRVVAYAGTAGGQLVRFEFCVADGCPVKPSVSVSTTSGSVSVSKANGASESSRYCSCRALFFLSALAALAHTEMF